MRQLYLIILALLVPFCSMAQSQSLEFYYIVYDGKVNTDVLCNRLLRVYEDAIEDRSRAVIFYLPSGQEPKIVKMNLRGDNRNSFDQEIIGYIRDVSRNRMGGAKFEYDKVMALIEEHDIFDQQGRKTYELVSFSWYVNPIFWSNGYNEMLIAKLYYTLDMANYPDYIIPEIWYQPSEEWNDLINNTTTPFGNKYKHICTYLENCFYTY